MCKSLLRIHETFMCAEPKSNNTNHDLYIMMALEAIFIFWRFQVEESIDPPLRSARLNIKNSKELYTLRFE